MFEPNKHDLYKNWEGMQNNVQLGKIKYSF